MPTVPENTDPEAWHRYFAVENNNRAWDLAAQTDRDREATIEMLNAAHAAARHWDCVGTELNRNRARMLLAEVHALVGFGSSALALAEGVTDYFRGRETADWEQAFVYTIHAHAAAVAGSAAQHAEYYQAAQEALEAIGDDQDRELVMLTFKQVPAPDKS